MEWLRVHRYAFGLGLSAFLIVAGIFIVIQKSAVATSGSQLLTWGGAGTVFGSAPSQSGTAQQNSQNSTDIIQQVQGAAPYTYIPISAPQAVSPDSNTPDSFDFNAFMALLSTPGKTTPVSQPSSAGQTTSAYAFIPGGLVSTTSSQKVRTALQQSLYDYGNEVGSSIQSFEQQYPNETQILTDQVQDRNDADKAEAVVSLGQALSALGDSLSQMDAGDSTDSGGNQTVPTQLQSAHDALAASYSDLGKKLALVPQAKSDTDFIAAINTYDASVNIFTKNYVALADLFAAYGVTFSPGDPGSVFTFTNASLSL